MGWPEHVKNPRLLWLVGYRCTGKTTVGQALARKLGWPFVDTDDLIQQRAGKTIREIFAEQGESRFRDTECEVIAELAGRHRLVIAAGGGAVLRKENVETMRRSGLVVLLEASPETIHRRLQTDARTQTTRPALTDRDAFEEIVHLLDCRKPFYDSAAHFRVSTEDHTVEEAVEAILSQLGRSG